MDCGEADRISGANLGLYSVTFNNDAALDRQILEAYKEFRLEAERKGFRHFLEVFDPNAPVNPIEPAKIGGFVNDMVVRCLAGVPDRARPLFLKMVYHGPKFTQELAAYDPSLVIGVLGGAAGTTYDAFKLIAEAQKYGAKVALYGRKINNAEHQLAFIEFLCRIVDGQIGPEEAVRAYHGVLEGLDIKPYRSLEDDMQLQTPVMSYAASTAISTPPRRQTVPGRQAIRLAGGDGSHARSASSTRSPGDGQPSYPRCSDGSPDFAKMTPAQRLAYHRSRLQAL